MKIRSSFRHSFFSFFFSTAQTQHVRQLHNLLLLFLCWPSFIRLFAGNLHMKIHSLGNLSIVLLELFVLATGKMTMCLFSFYSFSVLLRLFFFFVHSQHEGIAQQRARKIKSKILLWTNMHSRYIFVSKVQRKKKKKI